MMKLDVPESVRVITIGVKCNNCGRTWGIKVDKYPEGIPPERFRCDYCFQVAKLENKFKMKKR